MDNQVVNKERISFLKGLFALSPVAVFVVAYLIVSIVVGDFYKMPLAVAMILASIWAILIFRGRCLSERIEVFSREAAQPSIMYMVWIFVLAGAFSSLAKEIGAIDSTVNFALSVMPSEFILPGLFIAACFISLAIGTSVGTVIALTPLATQMASVEGSCIAMYVATVLGGAFFGDNLSFISDTTIAATRSQGTDMRDKFRANIWIALPAAIISLILYCFIGSSQVEVEAIGPYNPWLLIPYLLVIVLALLGINVMVVLISGIIVSAVLGTVFNGDIMNVFGYMGDGIQGMGNLIVITLLAGGMLGIIKEMGGIKFLLSLLTAHVKGIRGAQTCIVALVSIVNVCTANNTIAIITVGELSHSISQRFGIDPRKSASLLDTASCIVQCLIPYGAQALMAAELAGISPVDPIPYLYYPFFLALMVALSIIFLFPRSLNC